MALTKATTEVLDVPGLTIALAVDTTANGVKSKLDLKANLASPALAGIPTAPTAVSGTDTTQIATTAFVTSSPAFAGIPTAPTATTGTNTTQLATTAFVLANTVVSDPLKANLASPVLTGVPTAPTAANGTDTTQIATTAFVLANAGGSDPLKANLASPVLTGIPTAPTAVNGTNTTQIATTAFVHAVNNVVAQFPVVNAPTNVTTTLTATQLNTRLLSATTPNGGATYVMPTGTLMEAALGTSMAIGSGFDWNFINLANAINTVASFAGNTGHTYVSDGSVGSAYAFRTRKNAVNSYTTYKLS